MSASDRAWIKIFRKLIDSRVFFNEGVLKVWIWCLCRASFKERFVSVTIGRGSTEVRLQPGQFIYGRKTAAEKLGMSESTVNDRMQKLARMGNIDIQPNTNFSIVTVCNWATYQDDVSTEQQLFQQPGNSRPTARQQPSDTIEEGLRMPKKVGEGIAPAAVGSPSKQAALFEGAGPPVALGLAELIERWNKIPGISRALKATDDRQRAFKARVRDPEWITQVDAALSRMAASSFCRGGGDKGWKADIDWFLKPNTFVKIFEGRYDDQPTRPSVNGQRPARIDPGEKYANVGANAGPGSAVGA
jgi:biotin operon repressor